MWLQAEVELTFEEEDLAAPKVRGVTPKKIVPAGRLQGQIIFDGASPTPEYKQLGTIVEKLAGGPQHLTCQIRVERTTCRLLPFRRHPPGHLTLTRMYAGVTYLAIRVLKAKDLKPADISGFSDPFVTVEWDGCEQVTRVITRELNPVWNETLYFPLKCAINKAVLENKSSVSVRVYDFDVAGPDLLGSFDVPLHKITAAELAQLDDEIQVDGKKHKGRVLRMEGVRVCMYACASARRSLDTRALSVSLPPPPQALALRPEPCRPCHIHIRCRHQARAAWPEHRVDHRCLALLHARSAARDHARGGAEEGRRPGPRPGLRDAVPRPRLRPLQPLQPHAIALHAATLCAPGCTPYASQVELLVGRPTERGAARHCGCAAARDRV
jgi:hypothetical protein